MAEFVLEEVPVVHDCHVLSMKTPGARSTIHRTETDVDVLVAGSSRAGVTLCGAGTDLGPVHLLNTGGRRKTRCQSCARAEHSEARIRRITR